MFSLFFSFLDFLPVIISSLYNVFFQFFCLRIYSQNVSSFYFSLYLLLVSATLSSDGRWQDSGRPLSYCYFPTQHVFSHLCSLYFMMSLFKELRQQKASCFCRTSFLLQDQFLLFSSLNQFPCKVRRLPDIVCPCPSIMVSGYANVLWNLLM